MAWGLGAEDGVDSDDEDSLFDVAPRPRKLARGEKAPVVVASPAPPAAVGPRGGLAAAMHAPGGGVGAPPPGSARGTPNPQPSRSPRECEPQCSRRAEDVRSAAQESAQLGTDAVEVALQRLHALATKQQIVSVDRQEPQAAVLTPASRLSKPLMEALAVRGIAQLYSHQRAAISAVLEEGENVVVATPTASGKSLIYNLPVLEAVLHDKRDTALYLFPVKALARDQMRALRELAGALPGDAGDIEMGIYDGDTPEAQRQHIRKKARVVFTTPEMLHLGMISNHRLWARFLRRLRFVVIDEAHIYRGVFGSHVALAMRRMTRVCRHIYSSAPQFICSTATIANPKELAETLTGVGMLVIDETGAPCGEKIIVCWQPPLLHPGDETDQRRRSPYHEAATVVAEMLAAGVKALVFVQARKLTEVLTEMVRQELRKRNLSHLSDKVESYRAGYSAQERQELEWLFTQGHRQVLVTTSALELGIDVGGLDATVTVGFPNTICSFRQQAGRAGRRGCAALAVLVACDTPLDQYWMRHPQELTAAPCDVALINPRNKLLLTQHIQCAAYELPLGHEADMAALGGKKLYRLLTDDLLLTGVLENQHDTRTICYRGRESPAMGIDIRGIGSGAYFEVTDSGGQLIERVEERTAFRRIHEGAVFQHRASTYQAVPGAKQAVYRMGEGAAVLGDVVVSERVVGFVRKNFLTDEVLEQRALDLPAREYPTRGVQLEVSAPVTDRLQRLGFEMYDALAAVRNLCLSLLPQLCMCDTQDVGGHTTYRPEELPTLWLFDTHPGGVGIADNAFSRLPELLQRALNTVEQCTCKTGCPACIHARRQSQGSTSALTKRGCVQLLDALLERYMQVADAAGACLPAGAIAHAPRTMEHSIEHQRQAWGPAAPRDGAAAPSRLLEPGEGVRHEEDNDFSTHTWGGQPNAGTTTDWEGFDSLDTTEETGAPSNSRNTQAEHSHRHWNSTMQNSGEKVHTGQDENDCRLANSNTRRFVRPGCFAESSSQPSHRPESRHPPRLQPRNATQPLSAMYLNTPPVGSSVFPGHEMKPSALDKRLLDGRGERSSRDSGMFSRAQPQKGPLGKPRPGTFFDQFAYSPSPSSNRRS